MSPSRLGEDGIPMTCWRVVFCLRWIQNSDGDNGPNPRSMLNTALPGSPGAAAYQNYYKGCYKRKMATHVMML
jgi:hypothetical protein